MTRRAVAQAILAALVVAGTAACSSDAGPPEATRWNRADFREGEVALEWAGGGCLELDHVEFTPEAGRLAVTVFAHDKDNCDDWAGPVKSTVEWEGSVRPGMTVVDGFCTAPGVTCQDPHGGMKALPCVVIPPRRDCVPAGRLAPDGTVAPPPAAAADDG